jgi:CRP/FNR family transcriptional regulator, cAMP and macrophage regulator
MKMTPLFGSDVSDDRVREAAWVARCVGRSESAPLREEDLEALASFLETRDVAPGAPLFREGKSSSGIWIVRSGLVELVVGSGRRRVVLGLLRVGDVDGDLELILDMPFPYSARSVEATRCLFIAAPEFERLLAGHPAVARRWLSSVATRVSRSQERILQLLGRSLKQQTARLLLDEEDGGVVPLPQRTLAAMLGAQRPSLNKVLRDLEEAGAVKLGYARVEIVDAGLLEKLVAA